MKKFYGNYLGLCINNNDPQKRGRVQVFIPHIMPALFENWNEVGEDIKMLCVGDNLPDSLPSPIVEKLMKILPWAESASPILGTSAPGNLITNAISTLAGAAIPALGAAQAVAGAVNNYFNQSPKPDAIDGGSVGGYIPGVTGLGNTNALLNEALKYAGGGRLGSIVRNRLTTPGARGGGACGRGTVAVVGALTGNSRFTQGSAGGNAQDFSTNGSSSFASSGIYTNKQTLPSNYLNDPSQWRVGDIVAADSNGFGHIQVYTGSGWVSDFQQGNKVLTNGYSGFALHRLNPAGEAAVAARASLFGGLVGGPGQAAPAESTTALERTSTSGQVAAPTPHQDKLSLETDTSKNNYGNIARPEVSLDAPVSLSLEGTQSGTSNEQVSNIPALNVDKLPVGLKPYAQDFISAGQKYNIDPNFLAAISWNETGGGTSRAFLLGNNAMGISNSKGPIYGFASVGESIDRQARSLANPNGYYKNATTIGQIGNIYSPVGAANDFYGTNSSWIPTVGKFYSQLTGKDPNSAVITRDGSPLPPVLESGSAETTGVSTEGLSNATQSTLVQNTDKHGAMAVVNMNNMAKGVFSYPAAGAVLWVFFREGDPNFPVYFAANYGEREWQSAYRQGSDAPGYKPAPTPDNSTTSTGGMMNLNGVGGMRWEDTTVPEDPTKDQKSLTIFGYDGSNIHFNEGYHQIFSKFDRRDSVEGDRWETTLGFKEEWVQGDSNEVCMGDVFVKIGNVSPPAVDAVTRIQQIIKECMEPVTQSSGGTSSTSFQGKSKYSKAAADTSTIKNKPITSTPAETIPAQAAAEAVRAPVGSPPSRTGGQADSPSQIINRIRASEARTTGASDAGRQQLAAAREAGFAR